MKDINLRELSKGFSLQNMVYGSYNNMTGEISQSFENGNTRKIFVFDRRVQIIDRNGKELYSSTLDINHPLIVYTNICYEAKFLLKFHAKYGYLRARRYIQEKKRILSKIEDIFRVI